MGGRGHTERCDAKLLGSKGAGSLRKASYAANIPPRLVFPEGCWAEQRSARRSQAWPIRSFVSHQLLQQEGMDRRGCHGHRQCSSRGGPHGYKKETLGSMGFVRRIVGRRMCFTHTSPSYLGNRPGTHGGTDSGSIVATGCPGEDVAFASHGTGWAIGNVGSGSCLGRIEKTMDGGRKWVTVYEGIVAMEQVVVSSEDHVWVLGQANASCYPNGEPKAGAPSILLMSTTAGQHWAQISLAAQGTVESIAFVNKAVGLAAAKVCPSREEVATACHGAIWRSTDSGQTWAKVASSSLPVLGLSLERGSAWAMEAGSGVSNQVQIISSEDAGHTWLVVDANALGGSGDVGIAQTGSIVFTSRITGWLTVYSDSLCGVQGCALSGVFATNDGGRSWTEQDPGKGSGSLPLVAAIGSKVLIQALVGGRTAPSGMWETCEAIYSSENNGASWSVAYSGDPRTGGLWFFPNGGGWAEGGLLFTHAFGQSWVNSPSEAPATTGGASHTQCNQFAQGQL